MKLKKTLSLLLSVAMLAVMFTGCDSSAAKPAPAPSPASPAGEPSAPAPEPTKSSFPQKPITIVCPWAAGAGADAICRMFEKLGPKYFGQPVVIVNKPGAGGQMATTEFLNEKSDGYTVLFSSSGLFTTQPYMTEVNYKLEDFRVVTGIVSDYNLLAINTDVVPANNLEEFIAYYKSSGKELKYGHSGSGAIPHILQAMLYSQAGIQAKDIPYNSGAESAPALLGGHVAAIAQGSSEIAKLQGSKNIKIVGTFGPQRSKVETLKDIPTMKEQGYDITFCVWRLFLVGKDTPDEVVDILQKGLTGIINDPEFAAFAAQQGLTVDPKSPETATATIEQEKAEIEPLFKELKIGLYAE